MLGLTEAHQLLLPTTLMFALAAVLAALVRLTNLWLNGRMAAAVGSDLSCESYRRTLYQPYRVHVQRNSANVITAITSHTNLTVTALNSFLQTITSCVVAIGLLAGLLLIDAPVALVAATLFGSSYGLLALTSNQELRGTAKRSGTEQLKTLQEVLNIRDVLLAGNQNMYLNTYQKSDRLLRYLRVRNNFIGTFPRFALEALGLLSIALLGFVLVSQRGSGSAVIPLLGAMALGAQRLLPTLQQIYNGWSILKSYGSSIDSVLKLLGQPLPPQLKRVKPFLWSKSIAMEDLYFGYCSEDEYVLKSINLEISYGQSIGIVGTTGSVKVQWLICLWVC